MSALGECVFKEDIETRSRGYYKWEGSCTVHGKKYKFQVDTMEDLEDVDWDRAVSHAPSYSVRHGTPCNPPIISISVDHIVPSWVLALAAWGLILHESAYAPQDKINERGFVLVMDYDIVDQMAEVASELNRLMNMSNLPCQTCQKDASEGFMCPCRRVRYCSELCQQTHWGDSHQDVCKREPPKLLVAD